MQRRTLLTGLAASLALAARRAHSEAAPLRIGVLNDMSGVYADYQGVGSVVAAQLAAEDFGGLAGGRAVEVIGADHQNQPDIGAAIARRWCDLDGVDMILDVPNSSVALAVAQIVREKNRVFIGSGKACSPNTVHWTFDTWELGHALGQAVTRRGGRSWFFLTSDYVFGHDLERTMTEAVRAAGGTVAGAVRHPLGTSDFSQYMLQAASSGADVLALANAGGDTTTCMKQAQEFGIAGRMRLVGPTVNINNARALGLASLGGILIVTPFYWDRDDAARAFAARFNEKHPRHLMPNDMQAGCYAATLAYLHAVAALGGTSADGAAVVAEMKRRPAEDRLFGTTEIRPDGRALHPVYLMQAKSPPESRGGWDYYKLLDTIPPAEAFRPLAEGGCPLVKS
jgi:branched-chain amino acid transport system substrate-binding protein